MDEDGEVELNELRIRADRMISEILVAAPAVEAGLRKQIASVLRASYLGLSDADARLALDAVLALPAVQRLVDQAAEAARLRAAVERVESILSTFPTFRDGSAWRSATRRALDGTDG